MNSTESILLKESFAQYAYTLGVMVTGVVLGDRLGGFDSTLFWAAMLVALGWVAYYHLVIVPRLKQFESEVPEALDESR